MTYRGLFQKGSVAFFIGCAANLLGANADLSYKTNWFPRVSPTSNTLWGVTHGNGIFVAVGDKGTILTSQGGGIWTVITTSSFQGDLYCVRYVNGLFVAGTTNGILVSADAQQWVYRSIPAPSMGAGEGPMRFSDIAYGLGRYVAVAKHNYPGGTSLLWSPDGVTWTERYTGKPEHSGQVSTFFPNPNWKSELAFGGGQFVAVGHASSNLPGEHRFLTSLDGENWVPSGPSYTVLPWLQYQPSTVTYGNGVFFAAGYFGGGPFAGSLYRSTNGTSWSVLGNLVHQGNFSGIAFGAGRVVALGGFALRVSTNNGVSWTGNDTSGPSIDWYRTLGITYNSGTFVAVGFQGTIIQSDVVEETPPFFIATPTNQVAQRGSTVTLRSRAAGSQPLSYLWYKDGLSLPNETNANLVLADVQPANAGAYSIVVSSPYGAITNTVSVTVSFVQIASYAGLTVIGIPGRTYRVEYLNAMEPPTQWHMLTNIVLPASPYIWIDYETPAVPKRYYRVSELP